MEGRPEEFRRPAQEAITGRRPLIVDVTACSFLDSSGLRAILQVHAALQDGNGPAVPMAVVIGDSPAGRLLSLTEVDKRLSVVATREEADEWLASARERPSARAFVGLAQVAYARQLPDDAVVFAEHALALEPENDQAARLLARLNS